MSNQPESRSSQLHDSARNVMPGGISRNTIYREPHPDYALAGSGCRVTDVDGRTRIDFANNMASLIHGHACPGVVNAAVEQIRKGSAFTLANRPELELASLLCQRVPWFEKIRFMNSGTEAVMAAIKAARAITGRPGVAKAEGTYHGTYDYAEISQNSSPDQWGSTDQPNSVPVAIGTPESVLQEVTIFPFNDVERTIRLLDRQAGNLACVLVDLMPHRAGLVRASSEFVEAIRDWTRNHQVILIFDEVISFRMTMTGAAGWYGVEPDLTTLGKIIGGGFPVGALAGASDLMQVLDPGQSCIPFPWSGTFSGNPVSMAAGVAAMELFDESAINQLNDLGQMAREELSSMFERHNRRACVTGAGSMLRIHLKQNPPVDYRTTWMDSDTQSALNVLIESLYQQGIMAFRSGTFALSTPMTAEDVRQLVEVVESLIDLIPRPG